MTRTSAASAAFFPDFTDAPQALEDVAFRRAKMRQKRLASLINSDAEPCQTAYVGHWPAMSESMEPDHPNRFLLIFPRFFNHVFDYFPLSISFSFCVSWGATSTICCKTWGDTGSTFETFASIMLVAPRCVTATKRYFPRFFPGKIRRCTLWWQRLSFLQFRGISNLLFFRVIDLALWEPQLAIHT